MTLIARIGSAILMLAVVLPAMAHSVGKPENSCGDGHFYFGWKKICVPYGGVPHRPSPPKDSDCPPRGWYWGQKEGCCVPEEPEKDDDPEPQCKRGWKWRKGDHKCCEDDTPPPPPPQPSNYPGHGHGPKDHYKRSNKARSAPLCPQGLEACPFSSLSSDYECIDTNSDIEACGGCPILGRGQDCTAIPYVMSPTCNQGACEVLSCVHGYVPSEDRTKCIAA